MKDSLQTRILVAGTAGGVGTTTVTSLVFSQLAADASASALGSPMLADHSGGDLGLRLPEGDYAAHLDRSLMVHDLGNHASDEALDLMDDSAVFLVMVTGATPNGVAQAERVLRSIRERHESGGLQRTLVVCCGSFGRHRIHGLTEKLQDRYGRRSLVVIPQDASLAAGGRVPLSRLNAETRRAQKQLVELLRARLVTRAR